MKRRCMAFVLTLALVLTILPMTAMAAGTDVAKIGSVGYPSIQAAVSAADDGDTIVIVKDHAVDTSTTASQLASTIYSLIDVEEKITIDWNGKKVTANTGSDNIVLINVQNGGDLTLMDSVGGGSVSVTSDVETYSLLCCFDDASKLTVDGGEYRLNKGMNGQGLVYSSEDETTTINGGTFRLDNLGTLQNGSPWIFNARGQNERNILVYGGSFYKADILHQYYPFEVAAPKTKALQKNGDWYTMTDAAAYTAEYEWSSNWYLNEVGYATLADAVAAAEAPRVRSGKTSPDESTTLLALCPVDKTLEIDFDFTINMNGNTILWTGSDSDPIFTVADGATLKIDDFVPVREDYTFLGWYSDAAYENAYDLSVGNVPENTSLYAEWEKNPEPIPETGDGMGLFVFAGLALISVLGMVVLKKREQF